MQSPLPVAALLTELETFATAVSHLLKGDDIDWQWRPADNEWSLTEVMCHLRDVEREVHQIRFRDILTAENVFLPGFTADDWASERHYQAQDGQTALADFLDARQQTLVLLKDIAEDDWKKRGEHAFFGPTSLHELAGLAVKHDQAHLEQLTALRHQK